MEMTPLQIEYIKYVREISTIDGLLQAMLHHLVDYDEEGIKACIDALYELDPDQANKFKIILNKNNGTHTRTNQ